VRFETIVVVVAVALGIGLTASTGDKWSVMVAILRSKVFFSSSLLLAPVDKGGSENDKLSY